jgi:hypothetical protein
MCIYGIFRDDPGFYCSKEGQMVDLKKIQAIVNMSPFKNP